MASQATTRQSQPRSMLADIIDSIFTPGTNSGLIRAMDMSFYALFVVLATMVVLTRGNGHVCALFALSVGLFASIKWCVSGWGNELLLVPVAIPRSQVRIDRPLTSSHGARFLVQIAESEEQHRREHLAKEERKVADAATKGGKAQ